MKIMKIKYDKKADSLYIAFSKTKTKKTLQQSEGFLVDLDQRGGVVGIEILNYSKKNPDSEKLKVSAGGKRIAIAAVG